jgi:hypothetical protein
VRGKCVRTCVLDLALSSIISKTLYGQIACVTRLVVNRRFLTTMKPPSRVRLYRPPNIRSAAFIWQSRCLLTFKEAI